MGLILIAEKLILSNQHSLHFCALRLVDRQSLAYQTKYVDDIHKYQRAQFIVLVHKPLAVIIPYVHIVPSGIDQDKNSPTRAKHLFW